MKGLNYIHFIFWISRQRSINLQALLKRNIPIDFELLATGSVGMVCGTKTGGYFRASEKQYHSMIRMVGALGLPLRIDGEALDIIVDK